MEPVEKSPIMSRAVPVPADVPPRSPPPSGLSAADLAELIASFNEVTAKLARTHERLQREVARLKKELRQANERLERSRRLAALGEMAAGIAHEVRNPLASIRLYAGILQQDLGSDPARGRTVAQILEAVRGLDRVVNDVLNFARDVQPAWRQVDAAALFERAVREAAGGVLPASTEPAGPGPTGTHVPPGEDLCGGVAGICVRCEPRAAVLMCDPDLMHRALANVIRNALEAMRECAPPPGGHVLTLEAASDAETCRLRVGDTGPGIPPRIQCRVFHPFFTTRKHGTGLGLAIVHRILEAHGGRVVIRSAAESAPGTHGTTIELLWPARRSRDDKTDSRGTGHRQGRVPVLLPGRKRTPARGSSAGSPAGVQEAPS